ncbi:MAG: hypothetical protein QW524_01800 [Candidatus Woesearchaeota archaeon]
MDENFQNTQKNKEEPVQSSGKDMDLESAVKKAWAGTAVLGASVFFMPPIIYLPVGIGISTYTSRLAKNYFDSDFYKKYAATKGITFGVTYLLSSLSLNQYIEDPIKFFISGGISLLLSEIFGSALMTKEKSSYR